MIPARIATCAQNRALLSRPARSGNRLPVLKKARAHHPMNRTIPGIPWETMIVQNCPWVPTDGPTSVAVGFTRAIDTGVPNPKIGDWETAWMEDAYNRA